MPSIRANSSRTRNDGSPQYTSGDLFSGAGGLSRGFHDHGFGSLFANDMWDRALHTFLMNFDPKYKKSLGAESGDILALPGSIEHLDPKEILARIRNPATDRSMQAGELDTLLGGPPCQGYSINSHIRSVEDPRNHLFRHYVRLLRGLAPKTFVLENVPGMFSLDGGRFFDELVATIRAPISRVCPGYVVSFKILNAAHYGVPQERFRVVVIGTRRDIAAAVGKVEVPKPVHYSLAQAHFKGGRLHTFHYAIGHSGNPVQTLLTLADSERLLSPITVSEAIGDLPSLTNGGGVDARDYDETPRSKAPQSSFQRVMRAGSRQLMNHWCRQLHPPNTERVKHIPAGGDWRSIPHRLLPRGMQRALRKDHTTRYGRLDPDGLSSTLLTKPDPHWGTFLHPDLKQQRLISVREAARIQSFHDTHIFYGGQVDQYRLCGNAVPPLMAGAIAAEVRETLDRYYEVESEQPQAGRRSARATG
jgi:DNA (cytosine-5)-methyltransferase 1